MIKINLIVLVATISLLSISGSFANLFGPSSARRPIVLDENEQLNLEQLVGQICSESNGNDGGLISRPSTIIKLNDYFEALLSENSTLPSKHLACAKTNRKFLNQLKLLVSTRNDNVCSDEKLILVGSIHKNFISKTLDDRLTQESGNSPYTSLKLFFMHYAMEISSVCKKNLINNLEWDLKEMKFNYNDEDIDQNKGNFFDRLLDGVAKTFTSFSTVQNFEDIVLFWDLIEGSFIQKDGETIITQPIVDKSGESIKLIVKTKSPEAIMKFQMKCRNKYRPIYEKLILPIVYLADLGYSSAGEGLETELNELRSNELVRKWYSITQICETVSPIIFLKDASIENNNELVIISKEEADELQASGEPQPEVAATSEPLIHYEPTTFVFEAKDRLSSIDLIGTEQLVKSVKLNLGRRDRIIRRVLSRFGQEAIRIAKQRLTSLFFSTKVEGDAEGQQRRRRRRRDLAATTEVRRNKYRKQPYEKIIDLANEQIAHLEPTGELRGEQLRGMGQSHLSSSMERRKRRKNRLGDVAEDLAEKSYLISYQHTQSWAEIWHTIMTGLSVLVPSRTCIFIVGSCIVFILILLILATIGGSFSLVG